MKRELLAVGVAVVLLTNAGAQAAVLYVDGSATGNNDGTTWTDAYTNLQSALGAAVSNDQVWVAAGTYYPTAGTNRSATFQMKAGVDLYGGFLSGMGSIEERDWQTDVTTLSGEIGSSSATDNCLHVITGADNWNGALDGFTVTRGYAWGAGDADPARDGAGLLIWDQSSPRMRAYPAIRNCRFVDNAANYLGAAVCFKYNDGGAEGPVVSNCVFESNSTWRNGGGGAALYHLQHRPITLVNCTFSNNRSGYSGGALRLWYSDPVLRGCTFAGNTSTNMGGAIWHDRDNASGSPTSEISGCVFFANEASGSHGGAVYWNRQGCTGDVISGCRFYANETGGGAYGGGALYAKRYKGVIEDCIFSANAAGGDGGGALWLDYSDASVRRTVLAGNAALQAGGGIKVSGYTGANAPRPSFTNVLLAGNYAKYGGGAIRFQNAAEVALVNCTLADNQYWNLSSGYGGGGIQADAGRYTLKNNVVYGNRAPAGGYGDQVFAGTGTTNDWSYGDLEGGLAGIYKEAGSPAAVINDGGGNLDVNPAFADGLTGAWTADAAYTNATGQTVLTDSGAAWTPGALAGELLNPDTNAACLLYYVVTNSATTVTVLGAATNGATGDAYRICDYRLKSRWGRWTALGFVTTDTTNSPCIDAGDPASAYGNEPAFNGNRVNMGWDGNTAQASKSAPLAVGPMLRLK